MPDYSELKRLAERIREGSILQGMNAEEAMFNFECAATPNVILALIAENERYRKYGCDTCDGSGHLSRADGEYFGACASCGAYELEQTKRERDQIKAENEALRNGSGKAADALAAARKALMVARPRTATHMELMTAALYAIDAAINQGEQS